MAAADSLRRNESFDARSVHKVEITIEPSQPNVVLVVHSRVFPTFTHTVPKQEFNKTVEALRETEQPEETSDVPATP